MIACDLGGRFEGGRFAKGEGDVLRLYSVTNVPPVTKRCLATWGDVLLRGRFAMIVCDWGDVL